MCVEDNGIVGGVGSVLLQTLNDARVDTPVRLHGIPQEFLDHAKRARILEQIGLTAQSLARTITEEIAEGSLREPGQRGGADDLTPHSTAGRDTDLR